MLLCKSCNTRFAKGPSACPSCGRRAFSEVSEARSADPLPVARRLLDDAKPDDSQSRASRRTAAAPELEELDVLAEAVDPTEAQEPKRDAAPPAARVASEPGPAVFHLSAAQVRTLVAEQPELLGPGLGIYTEGGKPVGVDYRTPVGAIDLLARDASGGLVVVMVPDARDAESLMPQVLGRVGYVRKHLAKGGMSVRGLVVIEEIPEALAYAAAGVSDTISFKTYRVALTFHDLGL